LNVLDQGVDFFFPYHEVSGVPVLFARMAEHIARRGVSTRVFDFPDGAMARALVDVPDVEVVPFREGEPVRLGAERVLVLQAILPYTLRTELQPDAATRLAFWTLHPMCWIPTLVPLPAARDCQARHVALNRRAMRVVAPRLRRKLDDFLVSLHTSGSLAFMDGTTFDSTVQRLGARIEDPKFMPVPCQPSARNVKSGCGPGVGGPFHMAWVGRIADFKVHVLRHTLREAVALAEQGMEIRFSIVGDGPELASLRSQFQAPNALDIRWMGTMHMDAVHRLLVEDVHLLCAMGTSALEGAGLGVPTLLLDVAYGPVSPQYGFRWIFDTSRFSLGDLVDSEGMGVGNLTLLEAVDAVRAGFEAISDISYNYTVDNHSIERIGEQFMEFVGGASFTFGQVPPYLLQKGPVRRVFEFVRNRNLGGMLARG
jgi:hypothetical protein